MTPTLSRRRTWLLSFWGGTVLFCVGLVPLCALFATEDIDPYSPLGTVGMSVLILGFTVRSVAKRGVRSIERGEEFKMDRHGPWVTSMLERRGLVARPFEPMAAVPEQGLRRHVILGDTVLIGAVALSPVAAVTVFMLS